MPVNTMEFESNYASELFDQFLAANTMRTVVTQFKRICNFLELEPTDFDTFYPRLKKGILNNWKAHSIFNKLDKKAANKVYLNNQRHDILRGQQCLIIGGGPCGLRTAIELQLLGAKHVLIVEKRDRISRNNVIHLWPFVIHDLKDLAGKKLNAKFCSGSIDHVSIRQLQLMLLKVALILGCDFVDNVEFKEICPLSIQSQPAGHNAQDENGPAEGCCCESHRNASNNDQIGAYAHFNYNANSNYPVITEKLSTYEFNILIGADGRRNLLSSFFPRKEFRGRLAIAITANFINNHTLAEAQVPEISGISFIYYQQLFKSLREQTNIDLENICYYKDDTHYLVATAKKGSLLARGVLIEDFQDTRALLSPENINQAALLSYAKDMAEWSTGLDNLKFALNHYGTADVAMFDFTTMYSAENACRIKEIYQRTKCCKQSNNTVKNGLLLTALVGDSLLEPFWPTGSGCARGFLSSMDAAWMCRQYAIKCLNNGTKTVKENEENILGVIAERESIYRLLAQTKSENLSQNFSQYTINPITRYPNLNSTNIMPNQCKHLLYSNLRRTIQNRQTLAEKRLRRITIACTPDTFKQPERPPERHEQIEESPEELAFGESNPLTPLTPLTQLTPLNGHQNGNKPNGRMSGVEYLANNQQYMTPSAYNLATLEKSRNKEIESVIRHRKQREEKLHQESLSSEERFMNHIRKQIKPKAHWFLHAKTENSYESNTSSNRSNNSSQEDLPSAHFFGSGAHQKHHFSNKVRDLEFKLNSHNTFNEERYLKSQKTNKHVDGVNVMVARLTLQDLLDPIKQEERLKEEVKRKTFLEKDYKFVGKLTKNDWNVKLFNGEESSSSEKIRPMATDKSSAPRPRPKERIAIFKEKLQSIESILTNGRTKVDEEVNRIVKESIVKKPKAKGEWIEKLKSELSDKQQQSHKKLNGNNKPFQRKRQSAESPPTVTDGGSSYLNRNPNVQYIRYEKLNQPLVTVKQSDGKQFHSLDRRYEANRHDANRYDQKQYVGDQRQAFRLDLMASTAKERCARCHESVMLVDQLCINGAIFHRSCLKCTNCGVNLRLSEVRHANNVIDDQNCICTLCSNENRLTRSNSTSNYSARLKESIKWKEMFLLNLDCQPPASAPGAPQTTNKSQINERVEYENVTDELLDDEEVTRLLNLDSNLEHSKDVCSKSSQSSDLLPSEEDESSDESSESESDTTGADVCSDQFDLSELESPKSDKLKKKQANKLVPEIVVDDLNDSNELSELSELNDLNDLNELNNLSDRNNLSGRNNLSEMNNLNDLSNDPDNEDDDERTLNEIRHDARTNGQSNENTLNSSNMSHEHLSNLSHDHLSNLSSNTTTSSNSTLNNRNDLVIPEKNKIISDISEVDEFDDQTENSCRSETKNGQRKVQENRQIDNAVERNGNAFERTQQTENRFSRPSERNQQTEGNKPAERNRPTENSYNRPTEKNRLTENRYSKPDEKNQIDYNAFERNDRATESEETNSGNFHSLTDGSREDDNVSVNSFKVEIPKIFGEDRQPKVLKSSSRPAYGGSFTEKVLRSRSSPSLNDQLSFSSYYGSKK